MLSREEKAYCRGLEALKKKDYLAAEKEFEICRGLFRQSRGFTIITEATRLLNRLRQEKEKKKDNIKENSDNGEKTIVCGQGLQEEAG